MSFPLNEDKDWRNKNLIIDKFQLVIIGRIILVILMLLAGTIVFHAESGYAVNVFTGFVSIFGSVYIIDALASKRESEREIKRRKDELIRQLRSRDNNTVLIALAALRDEGWLENSLQGKNLTGGNFEDADFRGINLQQTILDHSNLQNVNFAGALLQGASLKYANLTRAIFEQTGEGGEKIAQCQQADLSHAILKSTSLVTVGAS